MLSKLSLLKLLRFAKLVPHACGRHFINELPIAMRIISFLLAKSCGKATGVWREGFCKLADKSIEFTVASNANVGKKHGVLLKTNKYI